MVIEQYHFQKLQHERQEKTCTIQRLHADRTGNCMENCFLLFTQGKIYYENTKKPLKNSCFKRILRAFLILYWKDLWGKQLFFFFNSLGICKSCRFVLVTVQSSFSSRRALHKAQLKYTPSFVPQVRGQNNFKVHTKKIWIEKNKLKYP